MKFTRKTDYALRAVQYLTRRQHEASAQGLLPVPVSVPVIAAESGISLRVLGGIIATLSRHGVVRTVPGPGGGVTLPRAPEAITVLDVVEAVEGRINLMDCLAHPETCSDANACSIIGVLQNAQGALVATLRATSTGRMVRLQDEMRRFAEEGREAASPEAGKGAAGCSVVQAAGRAVGVRAGIVTAA